MSTKGIDGEPGGTTASERARRWLQYVDNPELVDPREVLAEMAALPKFVRRPSRALVREIEAEGQEVET